MTVIATDRKEIRNFINIHLPDERYLNQESELFEFNGSDEIIGISKTIRDIHEHADQLFIPPEVIYSFDDEEVINMFRQMQLSNNPNIIKAYQYIDIFFSESKDIMEKIWEKYYEVQDDFEKYISTISESNLYICYNLFLDGIEEYYNQGERDMIWYKGDIMIDLAKKFHLEDEMSELIYANKLLPIKNSIHYIISPEYIKYFEISMSTEADVDLVEMIDHVSKLDN